MRRKGFVKQLERRRKDPRVWKGARSDKALVIKARVMPSGRNKGGLEGRDFGSGKG